MRQVTGLSNNGDVFDDSELDFIDDVSEANSSYTSLQTCATDDIMATVFPSSGSSDHGLISHNKNIIGTKSQRQSPPVTENPELVSKISKNIIAVTDSSPAVDLRNKRSSHLHKNNNSIIQSETGHDCAPSEQLHCQGGGGVSQRLKGKASSGFHDTVVQAFIEQQTADIINKADEGSLKNKRDHLPSDKSEKRHSNTENCCGNKCCINSSCDSTTSGSNVESTSSSASSMTWSRKQVTDTKTLTQNVTASEMDFPSSSTEVENISQNGNLNQKFETIRGCPSSPASVGSDCSSSAVDFQPPPTREQTETKKIQESMPLVKFTKCDDAITTEITSQFLEPESALSTQDGGGEGKKRWSSRFTSGFTNFFQKLPANASTLSGTTETAGQDGPDGTSAKKTPGKEPCQHMSFAGKLITSFTGWRRKPLNRPKSISRHRNKKDRDEDEKREAGSNTKPRIPIFVSPENQVEIVEESPAGIAKEQKQLLRESWSMIKTNVTEVGVETFMGLFHTHPDSIDSFLAFKDKSVEDLEQSAVLKAHALRVMQTVDKCITRLDDGDKMASVLCTLGKRHIGYQANASLIPMIGKQFISAIKPKMGNRWSDEVHAAWDILFKTINYNMRRGMMLEKHRLSEEAVLRKK